MTQSQDTAVSCGSLKYAHHVGHNTNRSVLSPSSISLGLLVFFQYGSTEEPLSFGAANLNDREQQSQKRQRAPSQPAQDTAVGSQENLPKKKASLRTSLRIRDNASKKIAPVVRKAPVQPIKMRMERQIRSTEWLFAQLHASDEVMWNRKSEEDCDALTPPHYFPPFVAGEILPKLLPPPACAPRTLGGLRKLAEPALTEVEDYYQVGHEGSTAERVHRLLKVYQYGWDFNSHMSSP